LMETTEDGCDYDYDSVGNVVKEECGSRIKTFRYDHNNLLTRAVLYSGRTMKFRYDPLGRRIWKEIMFPNGAYSRTFYRYGLGNNPLFEYKEEYTPDISSCFLAGTKVLMANNTEKNIEDVKVGEYVIGRDGKAEVYELESPIREDYYIVSFEDGNELRVTNEHPIYARNNKDEGWSSIIPEATWDDAKMDVSRLTEESEVLMIDGWMGIKEIKHVKEIIQTYNLKSVEGSTFYAGGVLVHNKNIPVRMMLDEPLDCPPNC